MDVPARSLPDELTWAWITDELSSLWQPFLLGSVITGLASATLCFFLTHWLWRLHVAHSWRKRCLLRCQQHEKSQQ